jgi:hypothetical protein
MDKYRGLPMDLADGSLEVLAEELGRGRILSTDPARLAPIVGRRESRSAISSSDIDSRIFKHFARRRK